MIPLCSEDGIEVKNNPSMGKKLYEYFTSVFSEKDNVEYGAKAR